VGKATSVFVTIALSTGAASPGVNLVGRRCGILLNQFEKESAREIAKGWHPRMNSTDPRLLRPIAVFKLLKALLLIAIGVGALKLLHADVTNLVEEWAGKLGLGPGSRHVGRFILEAASLSRDKIKDLAVGSFLYAGLFLTEGIGLWLLKRWAEWFTVILTSSLIPVEVYEIHRHLTVIKVLLLLINVVVAGFLIYLIRAERSEPKPAKRP